MHVLNPYLNRRPDFDLLATRHPAFAALCEKTPSGKRWVNFRSPPALRALTTALLKDDFNITVDLKLDRLCPTIANRLDYLLHVLDLIPHLSQVENGLKARLRALDIGTGHVVIYPLLLHRLRPEASIVATESDEASFMHAEKTLRENAIQSHQIRVVRANESGRILNPLFEEKDAPGDEIPPPFTFTVCNPPFFGSIEEANQGAVLKSAPPSSAPTAALNELVTRGGEVAFIGQMIDESILVPDRCILFTSLVGKYASLQPLVEQLRQHKIDNYFVKSIRQAKTTRWIIGWSFGFARLPDSLNRPLSVIPNTSLTRLLPLPNTFIYRLDPSVSISDLKQTLVATISAVGLLNPTVSDEPETAVNGSRSKAVSEEVWSVRLEPTINSWSRSARRAAARLKEQGEAIKADHESSESADPLFRARLRIIMRLEDDFANDEGMNEIWDNIDAEEFETLSSEQERTEVPQKKEFGAVEVQLDWEWGKDRAAVDSLWKYLLTKSGLNKRQARGSNEEDLEEDHGNGERGCVEGPSGRDETDPGRGRGLGRRRRGNGSGMEDWRGKSMDNGWKRRLDEGESGQGHGNARWKQHRTE